MDLFNDKPRKSPGDRKGTHRKRQGVNGSKSRSRIPADIKMHKGLCWFVEQLDKAAYLWYRDRGAIAGQEVIRWRKWFVRTLVAMDRRWPGSFYEWCGRNRVILPFGTLDIVSNILQGGKKGGDEL
jgi:hypothetical protein